MSNSRKPVVTPKFTFWFTFIIFFSFWMFINFLIFSDAPQIHYDENGNTINNGQWEGVRPLKSEPFPVIWEIIMSAFFGVLCLWWMLRIQVEMLALDAGTKAIKNLANRIK